MVRTGRGSWDNVVVIIGPAGTATLSVLTYEAIEVGGTNSLKCDLVSAADRLDRGDVEGGIFYIGEAISNFYACVCL